MHYVIFLHEIAHFVCTKLKKGLWNFFTKWVLFHPYVPCLLDNNFRSKCRNLIQRSVKDSLWFHIRVQKYSDEGNNELHVCFHECHFD